MKRKIQKEKTSRKTSSKKNTKYQSRIYFYLIVGGITTSVLLGTILTATNSNSTLGTQTLIASKGSDDSGGSDSSGSGSSDDDSGNDSSGSGGDDSSGNSGSDSDSSKTDGTSSDSSGSSGSGSDSSYAGSVTKTPTPALFKGNITPTDSEDESESNKPRIKIDKKKNDMRSEITINEGERIRVRTKDGRERIEITSGGIKTRLEYRDDRVIIKAEREDGTEVELEDDTIFKIDQRLGTNNIKVATAGANTFVLQRGTTGAVTQFPLSIDFATNRLIVTTPQGEKELNVLPDKAIENLIAANIVSRLGVDAVTGAFSEGITTDVSDLIILGELNGIPVYEINGLSDQKLLGIVPVTIEKTVVVSAQDGIAVKTEISFMDRIVDLFSF